MDSQDIPFELDLTPDSAGRSKGIHVGQIVQAYGEAIGYFRNRPSSRPNDPYKPHHFEKGFLWEQVLSDAWARRNRARREDNPDFIVQAEYEKDGIYGTVDVVDLAEECVEESKATTKSSAKFTHDLLEEHFPLWLVQVKAYCWMADVEQAKLVVFFLCGDYKPPFPEVRAKLLTFHPRELAENWNMMKNIARSLGWKDRSK